MRKKVFMLVALIVGFSLVFGLNRVNDSKAGGGCCKERKDSRKDNWRENGMNFRDCRDENRRRDNKDDLYRPIGHIWWDENC